MEGVLDTIVWSLIEGTKDSREKNKELSISNEVIMMTIAAYDNEILKGVEDKLRAKGINIED